MTGWHVKTNTLFLVCVHLSAEGTFHSLAVRMCVCLFHEEITQFLHSIYVTHTRFCSTLLHISSFNHPLISIVLIDITPSKFSKRSKKSPK